MRKNSIHFNNLLLSFWNVDGLYFNEYDSRQCKLDDPDVSDSLVKQSIVCLAETHCGYTDNPTLPGFSKPVQNIRSKSPNAKKTLWWSSCFCQRIY